MYIATQDKEGIAIPNGKKEVQFIYGLSEQYKCSLASLCKAGP